METIKRIVVAGEVVIELDIRIWPGSVFVTRFGLHGEVTFQNERIEDEIAYCTVVGGQELLDKLRTAA